MLLKLLAIIWSVFTWLKSIIYFLLAQCKTWKLTRILKFIVILSFRISAIIVHPISVCLGLCKVKSKVFKLRSQDDTALRTSKRWLEPWNSTASQGWFFEGFWPGRKLGKCAINMKLDTKRENLLGSGLRTPAVLTNSAALSHGFNGKLKDSFHRPHCMRCSSTYKNVFFLYFKSISLTLLRGQGGWFFHF